MCFVLWHVAFFLLLSTTCFQKVFQFFLSYRCNAPKALNKITPASTPNIIENDDDSDDNGDNNYDDDDDNGDYGVMMMRMRMRRVRKQR